MNKEDEIRESIEFCKDIYLYYEKDQQKEESRKSQSAMYLARDEAVSQMQKELPPANPYETLLADMEEEEESSWRRELRYLLLCLLVAFAVAKLLSTFVIQFTVVHGNSMETTVSESDYLLVGKLNYHIRDPKRFDVIVLSKDGERHLIKRVIGLPGENVRIEKGDITINGEVLQENYGLDPMDPKAEPVEITLAEDEFFVLGDNRLVSLDSRFSSVGPVKRSEILGKALVRVYPFHKISKIA